MTNKIRFVNSILDNVHGFIGLTKVESEIERLPIFKRLQNISQLGLTNRIFPCALHNRYTHSLGVMHIVDQMAIQLGFDDDERQLVRLAGMLHDIGHYPFSHDVEKAYKDYHESISESVAVGHNSDKKEKKLFLNGRDNPYHHEAIGSTIIRHSAEITNIVAEHYVKDNPKFADKDPESVANAILRDISYIITGDIGEPDWPIFSEYFREKSDMMVQIMHSELDADRFDYLLRDSTFSGTSYGSFDLSVLIRELTSTKDSKSGRYIVGILPSGIGCAEQFLLNRYFAYSQIIHHKDTAILGFALQSAVKLLLESGKAIPGVSKGKTCAADIISAAKKYESDPDSTFIKFTDAYLINCFTDDRCDEQASKLIHCIKHYMVPKMEDELINVGINNNDATMNTHPLFQEYLASETNRGYIYLLKDVPLTSHKSQAEFDNETSEIIGANEDSTTKESRRLDRLLDGLVVIDKDKEPILLIDSEQSMLRDIYKLRYRVVRKYSIPKL
ncbi:MAG: HD domain-containing protein [Clostridia bacterium]|nr:HD domain-containing protein [Clostridia bacterium]